MEMKTDTDFVKNHIQRPAVSSIENDRLKVVFSDMVVPPNSGGSRGGRVGGENKVVFPDMILPSPRFAEKVNERAEVSGGNCGKVVFSDMILPSPRINAEARIEVNVDDRSKVLFSDMILPSPRTTDNVGDGAEGSGVGENVVFSDMIPPSPRTVRADSLSDAWEVIESGASDSDSVSNEHHAATIPATAPQSPQLTSDDAECAMKDIPATHERAQAADNTQLKHDIPFTAPGVDTGASASGGLSASSSGGSNDELSGVDAGDSSGQHSDSNSDSDHMGSVRRRKAAARHRMREEQRALRREGRQKTARSGSGRRCGTARGRSSSGDADPTIDKPANACPVESDGSVLAERLESKLRTVTLQFEARIQELEYQLSALQRGTENTKEHVAWDQEIHFAPSAAHTSFATPKEVPCVVSAPSQARTDFDRIFLEAMSGLLLLITVALVVFIRVRLMR